MSHEDTRPGALTLVLILTRVMFQLSGKPPGIFHAAEKS